MKQREGAGVNWTLCIVLVGSYIALQMVADITAVKMITLLGLVLPGGTLVYAPTFTVRDLIHRKLGKKAALITIALAGVINVAMAGYLMLVSALPYPQFWGAQEAFVSILGVVWHIVIASIIAEVVSEFVDTHIYHAVQSKGPGVAVLISNLVSVPLDSIVFGGLAFGVFPAMTGLGHAMAVGEIWTMVQGQSIFKYAIGTVVMPLIYAVRSRD